MDKVDNSEDRDEGNDYEDEGEIHGTLESYSCIEVSTYYESYLLTVVLFMFFSNSGCLRSSFVKHRAIFFCLCFFFQQRSSEFESFKERQQICAIL